MDVAGTGAAIFQILGVCAYEEAKTVGERSEIGSRENEIAAGL